MNRSTKHHDCSRFTAWARRAATVGAVLAGGLGVALAAFAAPLPTAPATQTPYSWPGFHAGGVPVTPTTPPSTPYDQLQGTPTGLYGTTTEQIPSLILGNTGAGVPAQPPGSGGTNGYVVAGTNTNLAPFLNHFFNGPTFGPHYFQIAGPLSFTLPPPGTPAPPSRVQSSPTVVNATDYAEIGYMYYDGVAASPQNPIGNGTVEKAAAPIPSGTPPGPGNVPPAAPTPADSLHAIRQVVFFGRNETIPVVHDPVSGRNTLGGVPVPATIPEGTNVMVGAVYAMDGFTGGIIWRYQTPSFGAGSSASNNTNSFVSHITGTANSASAAGPQPFQVGPTAYDTAGTAVVDSAPTPPLTGADSFAPGNFDSYTPSGSLPAQPPGGFGFSLYAKTATPGANNTVVYTGTWRIFAKAATIPHSADDGKAVATGTFTATAIFDLGTDPTGRFANVAGTFNADSATSPTFAAGFPAVFNGTFDARSGAQIISGSLQTIPSGATLRDAGVLSSVAVARVNVNVPAGYPGATAGNNVATKLVVIAADNNGYVYCLDALGNGYRDPAPQANGNVLYQNTNPAGPNYTTDPTTVGQVHYDVQSTLTTGVTYAGFAPDTQPHVGTTFPYWIYRPDPAQPRYVAPVTGTQTVGAVKAKADFDPTRDLPVPQAFNNASPTVHVDPTVSVLYNTTTPDLGSLRPGAGPNTSVTGAAAGLPGSGTGGPLVTNAAIYAGNSNGVLYALDGLGLTDPTATSNTDANANTYNNSVTGNPGIDDTTGTTQTLWWFSAPGATPAAGTDNPVSIESAPAVLASDPSYGNKPTVYVATSNPAGGGSSTGRLYAIDALVGPTGNGGNGAATPGSAAYNINAKGRWAFPNAYGTTTYAALGNISGSPVVFNNTDDGTLRIYFAANTGKEMVQEAVGNTQSFPASDNTGRIWGVNTDGTFGFAYPGAVSTTAGAGDPNKTTLDTMNPPIGGFLHTTPAVGFVTFPASIYSLTAGGAQTAYSITDSQGTTTFSGAANRTVPMLYAGTSSSSGVTGAELQYVDLDGTNDAQRGLYAQPAPNGTSFRSSPILVANTSATGTPGGNGGSIFVTTSDNHLLQYQATPITTANTSAPFPSPRLDYTFPGGDAVSAPAVGSARVSDLTSTQVFNAATGTFSTQTVSETATDWVYVGDATTGFCFGFTPRGFGTDTTGNYLPTILPSQNPYFATPAINQFPLRAFVYDNTTGASGHPASSLDMNKANPYGQSTSALPIFEWGQTVYFRIANVVPPAPATDTFSPTSVYAMLDPTSVNDPSGPSYFYNANGGIAGGVTFQTTEVDTSGQAIGNTTDSFYVPPVMTTDPSTANGFYERTDSGTTTGLFGPTSELDSSGTAYRAPETVLLDSNKHGYAAAVAYCVGFNGPLDLSGQSRHNTPGARRKLVSVIQSVTRYAPDGSGGYKQQVVQLHLVNDPNFSYLTGNTDTNGTYTDSTTASLYVDEPTFGILNPLAVRGAGVSLAGSLGTQATWLDGNGLEGAGPFQGIDPADLTTAGVARTTAMEALANGNSVLTNPPPSGVLVTNSDPSHPSATAQANAAAYLPYFRYVVTTSTGQIPHGSDGDNADPKPVGIGTGSHAVPLPTGTDYGTYLLNIADRSLLGPVGGALNVAMQRATLGWNDNTGSGGPSARINPLSWDDYPLVGQNSSRDYPDIGASNLTEYINGNTGQPLITPNKQTLQVAAGTGINRTVSPESVLASIHVPKYQPANLQLWGRSGNGGGPLPAPSAYTTSGNNFPEGYVALQRIAATSNPNATPNVGTQTTDAYRDVYVYTGVPVDMSTSIGNPVVDTGVVPHGFGLETQSYSNANAGIPQGLFAPVTPSYQPYFRPVTVYHNGNTNLINPHFDQKINEPSVPATLPLLSDALDSNIFDPFSYIPAFDANSVRTGARIAGALPAGSLSLSEQPYLLRSSLDTDLANVYGIYPGVSAGLYPVVTFHKPRVSDANNPAFAGTVMTVPDHPHDVSTNNPPPQVSVAVPLGTPVGTYSQVVRLFEGLDVPYDALIGPTYNGIEGGYKSFNPTTLDTFQLALNGSGVPQAEQPYSDPGTLVKVTVREDRLTDAFTPGALPMFDTTAMGTGGTGAADLLPAAFRDPATGDMTLYWTTSRAYTKGGGSPLFNIAAANLAFNTTSGAANFQPIASNQQWWKDVSPALLAGSNVGWSVAPDQRYALNGALNTSDATAYGFDINVAGTGPNALSNLYCYQIKPSDGSLIGSAVSVANSPQPKSGVHGLKFSGISFADPNSATGQNAIGNNLWAFWSGGTRGRTALYYSSTTTGSSGSLGAFAGPAILPVPASLTALSNPSAVLTYAPDPTTGPTGTAIPVIEVTYSGVGPSGSANLYLSRYRPYHPVANNTVDPKTTLLAALPFRRLTEQLQLQAGGNWWQARDVGWLRITGLNNVINVLVGVTDVLAGKTPTYDQASGLLVYTGVTLNSVTGQTVYVDVGGGRVRFSRPLPANTPVAATFNPTARRITTDSVADFAPSVFLDEAYQPNSSGVPASGTNANVQADRYWFVWQKAGIPGTATVNPTLWYKTQRLTVALTDASGIPLGIKVIGGKPNVTVKVGATTLYDSTNGGVVDVDATRGRLYFPVTNGTIALEGQTVSITGTDTGGNALPQSGVIHWVDEPRYNDPSSQVAANDTTPGAIEASASDGYLVPINTVKNEGGVAAFLDPSAYVNTSSSIVAPHSVWLFWNSTRNGTSDIFYETINPRFNPVAPASGAP